MKYYLSSGAFKLRKLVLTFTPYVLILVFTFLSSWTAKAINSIFFKPLILVKMVLCFSIASHHLYKKILMCFFISIFNFNVLTHSLILRDIKTNGLITLFQYPIRYLESVFSSTDFKTNVLPILAFQVFTGVFLHQKFFLLLLFSCHISPLLYHVIIY